jgi:hypothetical protein
MPIGDAKFAEIYPVTGNSAAETGSIESAHTATDLKGRRRRPDRTILPGKASRKSACCSVMAAPIPGQIESDSLRQMAGCANGLLAILIRVD